MEKYSKWRDLGTGIHPFLSSKGAFEPQQFRRTFSRVLRFPIAFFRLCLLVVFVLPVYFVTCKLFSARKRRKTCSVLAWLTLKCLGFGFLVHENLSKKYRVSKENLVHLENGDIILCNHVSWLDFLIFEYFYSPQFYYLTPDSMLYTITDIFDCVFNIYKNEQNATKKTSAKLTLCSASKQNSRFCSIEEAIETTKKNSLGPIVVFPEAATTNGKALLRFNLKDSFMPLSKCFISTINYSSNVPPSVFGSLFANIHSVADNLFNYATLNIFPYENIVSSLEYVDNADFSNLVSNCIASLARIRIVNANALDKQEFLKYYREKRK